MFNGAPARLSVLNSPAWGASLGEGTAEVYKAALANYQPVDQEQTTMSPISWPFYTWRSQLVTAALNGDNIQTATRAAQDKADSYLACMAPVDIEDLTDEELSQQVVTCAKQADPTGQW